MYKNSEKIIRRFNKSSLNIGDRKGRLVILEDLGTELNKKTRVRKFNCICDCGTICEIWSNSLVSGNLNSCGCLRNKPKLPNNEAAINKVIVNYKNNAKQKKREFSLTKEQIINLFNSLCAYCGAVPSTLSKTKYSEFLYNGIDRVDNEKGYTSDNTKSCCKICNRAKYNLTLAEFYNSVQKIYLNIELKKLKQFCSDCLLECGTQNNQNYKPINYNHLNENTAAFRALVYSYKKNAKNRNIAFELSDNFLLNIFKQNCFYCDKIPSSIYKSRSNSINFIYNGIDRLNNSAGYFENNVVPCCGDCNLLKGILDKDQFLEWITNINKNIIKITF